MNVVMNSGGAFVEVQGTAEGHAFRRHELDQLLDLAAQGIAAVALPTAQRPCPGARGHAECLRRLQATGVSPPPTQASCANFALFWPVCRTS